MFHLIKLLIVYYFKIMVVTKIFSIVGLLKDAMFVNKEIGWQGIVVFH